MIDSPLQVKAVCALLARSQEQLASAAEVSSPTIKRLGLTRSFAGRSVTGAKIKLALEKGCRIHRLQRRRPGCPLAEAAPESALATMRMHGRAAMVSAGGISCRVSQGWPGSPRHDRHAVNRPTRAPRLTQFREIMVRLVTIHVSMQIHVLMGDAAGRGMLWPPPTM
jgi:hypothetical protein